MSTLQLLLIDDSPEVRDVLAFLCKRWEWEPCMAPSSEQAQATLLSMERAPDLVLLDYALPGDNGLAFYSWAMEQPQFADLRIALFSHLHMESTIAKAFANGIRFVIGKELLGQPAQFLQRINEILQHAPGSCNLKLDPNMDARELERRCQRLELVLSSRSIGGKISAQLIKESARDACEEDLPSFASRRAMLEGIVARSKTASFLVSLWDRLISFLGSENCASLSFLGTE